MRDLILAGALSATLGVVPDLAAEDLVFAKDGSGVYGYKDTPRLPWCGYLVHDPDRPAPPRVDPGPAGPRAAVPSDAIVLFDGTGLAAWEESQWRVVDGVLEAGPGNLVSRQSFGDFHLHVEWMAPAGFEGARFDQGNNGVRLHGLYEIQIFDSWNEKIYPDGQAAAVYGQTPPLVNACRPPGQWQTYDILLRAPEFRGETLVRPARVTVLHNGVVAQWDTEIHGETGHRILPEYKSRLVRGPVQLSGHNCPVRFRSIWIRPLG
jgi:hypothetical protein